jgi:RND family efflux transporter MFP subunit
LSIADSLSAVKPFLLLFPCLISASLLSSCHRAQDLETAPKAPPIAVQAARVTWTKAATPVVAPALLARTLEADLSFKTGGVIAEVSVRAGAAVRAGQLLGSRRMEELDAAVSQAESALTKATRDLERFSELVGKNAEPLEKQQNAESSVEQAKAALQAARFNRQTAVLTAPAAGRILARFAEPGEIAAPGRTILRFASDAEGWLVRVGLAQRDVVRVKIGDPATIRFVGLAAPLQASVARIAGEVDAATRTTPVELRVQGSPPAELRSGMVGRAQIQPGDAGPRALLPLSALVEGEGKRAHLFRIEGGWKDGDVVPVRRIPVEIEEITAAGAVVAPGWGGPDTSIVVTGAELLADGMEALVNPAWPLANHAVGF